MSSNSKSRRRFTNKSGVSRHRDRRKGGFNKRAFLDTFRPARSDCRDSEKNGKVDIDNDYRDFV